jgi:hypothetical protein
MSVAEFPASCTGFFFLALFGALLSQAPREPAADLRQGHRPDHLSALRTVPAYGAEARWDDAVATALEALRGADPGNMGLANEIRKRLDLYRRRIPFIVPEG